MRGLKVLVIVMGVLIVGGMAVVMAVLVQRFFAPVVPHAMAGPVTLDEPAGSRIVAASGNGERLVLQLQGGGPDRVVVIDLRSGQVTNRVGLAR
jgi:hypothetical protein